MTGAAPELSGDLSPAEDDSRVIECQSDVLQSLRTLVLERFNQMPHGGAETFGVLFGTRQGDELRITAVRPLPVEATFAASSALSAEEREAFRNLVLAIQSAPDLAGIEPVGWFRAHPRSGLGLSPRDLEISTFLFPEIWQVAMVLRPGNSTPSCVRLYFRDSDGALHPDRAFREFTVPFAAGAPAICDTEDNAAPDNGEAVFTSDDDLNSGTASPSDAHDIAGLELLLRRNVASLAESLRRISPGWLALRWPMALLTAACVVGAFYWVTRPPSPLALLVQDSAGQLVISWDKTIRPVQNAQSAHLEIGDGSSKLWLELDREQLRMGNVTYKRRSADVTVRLVVPRPGAPPLEEMARFLGPVGQQPASATDPAVQNRPLPESASRINSQPRDTAYGRAQGTALLVPVLVDQAAGAIEAPPKFTPPSTKPAEAGATQTAAPELVAPPQLQHQALSIPLQAHTELPPENLVRPPAPAPPPPAANPVPSAHVVPTALATGRLLWIGRLQKNQTLKINGKICSTGTLSGELPLRPVKISVSPGDLSTDGIVLYTSNLQYANNVVEPPSAQNGWNRTVYTWNPRFANDIAIQESPAPENGWSRLVLRSKNPKMSVIVIDWAVLN